MNAPRPPLLRLGIDGLIIDSFAGGGGASTGIARALGRRVDIAINHDPEAIAMHAANHPETLHYVEDVWKVDPEDVTRGQPVAFAWFSPDCKHHSKAKGGKPRDASIRGLAWVALHWAKAVRPRVIFLENVEEFQKWGPLLPDGQPCPARMGLTFRRFVKGFENLGYRVEWRELRACDYGAPTTRKRLFMVARCDGQPIRWPSVTHGPRGALPYRTAAECIDWTIPCPSIFERSRPLAENTQRRIAEGIRRFVLENPRPFIVGAGGPGYGGKPVPVDRPMGTLLTENRRALVVPYMVQRYGERPTQAPRAIAVDRPMGTIVPTANHGTLVAAFLAKHNGIGHKMVVGQGLGEPVHTITATDQKAVVTAQLAHQGNAERVAAFLMKFYSEGGQWANLFEPMHTIPTKDRMALVTVQLDGEPYVIVDIGMRMLTPRELYRAQGFPEGYIIDATYDGEALTKTAQVRMCGNSVSPPNAEALVAAQFAEELAEVAA